MTPLLPQRSRADRHFERLYRRHAGDVYRYALAVMRNQADAEDVTQTTFMNAYRAFSHGERPERPKNWLIAIAHNVCRQRFRQAARRPSEVQLNDDVAEALVAEEPIGAQDIQRALGQLAFNQRSALVMRELEGRSYVEIAGILGVSVAAVETLIFRARRALREQLEGVLTCDEAELAISKQADGQLARAERGQLRAHLRQCESCATLARRLRAQRGAWKALGAIPLPGSLAGFFGGSGASAATSLGLAGGSAVSLKAAAAVSVVAIAGGSAYEGTKLIAGKSADASSKASLVEEKASASTSPRAARAFAPGQIKAPGTSATKPAVPPGRAKKGATTWPAADAPGHTKRTSSEGGPKAEPRGQTKKAEPGHRAATRTHPKPAVAADKDDKAKKKPKKVAPGPKPESAKAEPKPKETPAEPHKPLKDEAAPEAAPKANPEHEPKSKPEGPPPPAEPAVDAGDHGGGNGGGKSGK